MNASRSIDLSRHNLQAAAEAMRNGDECEACQ